MSNRKPNGFWWVFREGQDWPSWYYGEAPARDATKREAYSNPGSKVHIGKLDVIETVVLPDKLETLNSEKVSK